MSLEPRAFGPPLQTCKDPSHNYLLQLNHHFKLIRNFLKYISLTKILEAPILFCWCWQKLVFGLKIMQQPHDSRLHLWSFHEVQVYACNLCQMQIYVMFRYARGDVALLRTLDQLIFLNHIARRKGRLVSVVRLFLTDTSFKTLKGGIFCKKLFQNFVFHVTLHKLFNLLDAGDSFSF